MKPNSCLLLVLLIVALQRAWGHSTGGVHANADFVVRDPKIAGEILKEAKADVSRDGIARLIEAKASALKDLRISIRYEPDEIQGGIASIRVNESSNVLGMDMVLMVYEYVASYTAERLKGVAPPDARKAAIEALAAFIRSQKEKAAKGSQVSTDK